MSAPKTYRWDTPGEWLLYHINERENLRSLAIRLAALLDSDEIQDEFQDEMEEDGYFRPQLSATRYHMAKRRST